MYKVKNIEELNEKIKWLNERLNDGWSEPITLEKYERDLNTQLTEKTNKLNEYKEEIKRIQEDLEIMKNDKKIIDENKRK